MLFKWKKRFDILKQRKIDRLYEKIEALRKEEDEAWTLVYILQENIYH